MPRKLSLRSPIPLIISAALFGCPSHNQECGPPSSGSATAFGLVVGTTIQTSYGEMSSSEAHDCVDPNAPAGVVALTITGFQTGGTGGLFTACLPRPDELATQPVSLGSAFQIVDFTGSADGCTYTFDSTQPVTGTVTADGLCGEGSAGYTLTFDGGLSVDRTCGSANDTVPLTLTGDVLVSGS